MDQRTADAVLRVCYLLSAWSCEDECCIAQSFIMVHSFVFILLFHMNILFLSGCISQVLEINLSTVFQLRPLQPFNICFYDVLKIFARDTVFLNRIPLSLIRVLVPCNTVYSASDFTYDFVFMLLIFYSEMQGISKYFVLNFSY